MDHDRIGVTRLTLFPMAMAGRVPGHFFSAPRQRYAVSMEPGERVLFERTHG
jgi:hypothetical protein